MARTLILTQHPSLITATPTPNRTNFLSMSELLTAAIADARQLDRRLYQPSFAALHEAGANTQCQVCLAGSLIAGTLEATPDESFSPGQFDEHTNNLLESLNYMRCGRWLFAFYEFHRRWPISSTEDQLRRLPRPCNANFDDWNTFNLHLDSLECVLPELREIEISVHWR